ncbi:MAG: DUF1272 domain-containing protein [Bacteroidetes bacterium]|nr:DUF1272 domain-containing protein [Bacteroidota bacterium]MBK9800404.1 DUF1272 domain-containing protein [Bacteroidota bacterium]
MLRMKPNCEQCGKMLSFESDEARICSYECTYCSHCVDDLFKGICPNCGGNFEKRPKRKISEMNRNPIITQ